MGMEGATYSWWTLILLCGVSVWFLYVIYYATIRSDSSSALGSNPQKPKKTLLLDLDETLVHSTIKRPPRSHFNLHVCLGRVPAEFFVIKRPFVDQFLEQVCKWYNVYIFTAGVKDYAGPLLEKLDKTKLITGNFFRDSCTLRRDTTGLDYYVKEFSRIRMDPSQSIIIDNQPISYSLNKDSAIPIAHFFDDPHDEALVDILPLLEMLRHVEDVRSILGLRVTNPH
jgi:Dullard-like phosphatase family protein